MIRAAVYETATGAITQLVVGGSWGAIDAAVSTGQAVVAVGSDVGDISHYVKGGTAKPYPSNSPGQVWNYAAEAWE